MRYIHKPTGTVVECAHGLDPALYMRAEAAPEPAPEQPEKRPAPKRRASKARKAAE